MTELTYTELSAIIGSSVYLKTPYMYMEPILSHKYYFTWITNWYGTLS